MSNPYKTTRVHNEVLDIFRIAQDRGIERPRPSRRVRSLTVPRSSQVYRRNG